MPTLPLSSSHESVISIFFQHFPLIQQPEHQIEILKYCLGLSLEFLSTSPSLSFSACSFATFQKHALIALQSLQSSDSNKQADKNFEDPFHVYPNWWGNMDTHSSHLSKAPKALPELIKKWGMTTSNSYIPKPLSSTQPKTSTVSEKLKQKNADSTQKKSRDEMTQTFIISPPKKPPKKPHSKLAKPARSFTSKLLQAPRYQTSSPSPSPSPSQIKTTAPRPPQSFQISAAPLKNLVQIAQNCMKDPVFQHFQTHAYLDELENDCKNDEWFKREWLSNHFSSLNKISEDLSSEPITKEGVAMDE